MIIIALTASLCVIDLSEAAEKPLPKFESLLPSEHFFNKEPLPVGHTYGFATNKTLKEIKVPLLKALGDGWKLEIAPPEVIQQMNQNSETRMEAVGQLVHKDYEKYSIGITLVLMPADKVKEFKNYSKLLSIITVDKEVARRLKARKVEQDSAEQPATAPGSKPEGDSNPKPESEGRSQ